jgi:MinD superfamily P-loop ATPase
VAVASGKGGTGKTLIATNLAWFLAEAGHGVTLADTDVEAPNAHLFLAADADEPARRPCEVPVPYLFAGTCSGCGDCQRACAFNAIVTLKDRVMVLPELCHGCGACALSCQERALGERNRPIGTISTIRSLGPSAASAWRARTSMVWGTLNVGEARAVPLVEGVLRRADAIDHPIQIVDAPPGTACTAVAAVEGADLVLLVTEPTPFGLHDLELAVEMCRALGRPTAAVVNRSDLGDRRVHDLLAREGIPLLGEIPFSRELARTYAGGQLAGPRIAGPRVPEVRSGGAAIPSLRRALDRIAWAVIERAG